MQHLVSLARSSQHVQAGATTDIRTQANANVVLGRFFEIEQSASKEEIGCRAKCDSSAVIGHYLAILIIKVQAMREHRSFPHEPKMIVDIQITPAPGKLLGDQLYLVVVLRKVGVHVHIRVFAGEAARFCELPLTGSHRETRCNCVAQAALPMPLVDQLQAVLISGFHVVSETIRAVLVHQDLARYEAHVKARRLVEYCVHRLWMNGRKYQCRCSAVSQQLIDEEVGDLRRVFSVRELLLGRIRVFVQPVEQLCAVGRNNIDLREMHVAIDQAGNDQLVTMLHDIGTAVETAK